ncbi:MAG: zf-HC2 domain-containing protein [Candidatus Zixiibacteriota bacterium]
MNCNKIKEKLSLYIDGLLGESDIRMVEEHTQSCAECKAFYEALLKLGEMTDDFVIDGDDSYWRSQADSVLEKIERAESDNITPVPSKKSGNGFYRYAAVAAAVLIVAFVSIYESMKLEPTNQIFKKGNGVSEVANAPVPSVAKNMIASDEETETSGMAAKDKTGDTDKNAEMDDNIGTALPEEPTATANEQSIDNISKSELANKSSKQIEEMAKKGTLGETKSRNEEAVSKVQPSPKIEKEQQLESESIILGDQKTRSVDSEGGQSDAYYAQKADLSQQTKAKSEALVRDGQYDSLRMIVRQYEQAKSSKKSAADNILELSYRGGSTNALTSKSAVKEAVKPAPEIDQMEIATAYYELGKATPDSTERERMIVNLLDLVKRADTSYVDSITVLIIDLQSLNK